MITIQIEDREVLRALDALRARVGDMTPAMRAAAQVLRSDILERFDTQTAPDGASWKPLSAASILSRARRHAPAGYRKRRAQTVARFASGAKALLDTGQLRNSIKVLRANAAEAVVGTKLPYAAIHHFGGKAGRGRKVTIPARPFMGLSREGQQSLMDVIVQHIAGGAP